MLGSGRAACFDMAGDLGQIACVYSYKSVDHTAILWMSVKLVWTWAQGMIRPWRCSIPTVRRSEGQGAAPLISGRLGDVTSHAVVMMIVVLALHQLCK
jgi:hypothetical protein